jgi:hypothetical protein
MEHLLYKLDTLLLIQKKLPILDIMGFFFRIRTQVKALVPRMRIKKPKYLIRMLLLLRYNCIVYMHQHNQMCI